jgi:beta-glucosidase/6-phospho-beta-glucosidase/beta-galactosidase
VRSRLKLTELLFGVATSDHQAEAFDPARRDFRDVWEELHPELTPRQRATEFWNRCGEDIDLAKGLGCKIFRFSISWAGVEPQPGQFNEAALDHYEELVRKIRDAQMEPLVTLHHFTWPIHIQEAGGMIAPGFLDRFEKYVNKVVDRLGDRIFYWVPFNEPNVLIYGYIKAPWQSTFSVPPGYEQPTTISQQIQNVVTLIRQLFEANRIARAIIKSRNPIARVGVNPLIFGLPWIVQKIMDYLTTSLDSEDQWKRRVRRFAERSVMTRKPVDLVIAQLTPTPARRRRIAFSQEYGTGIQRFFIKKHSGGSTKSDLQGRRIGVVKGSTAENAVAAAVPSATIRTFDTHSEILHALDDGSIDAAAGDDVAFQTVGIPETVEPGQELQTQPYAVGVAHANPDLQAIVDSAISGRDLSGSLETIDGGPVESIRRRGVIRIGVTNDQTQAPRNAISQKEKDIAENVAKKIFGDTNKIRWEYLSASERVDAISPISEFFHRIMDGIAVVTTALNGNWWHLGMSGKLPEFLCPKRCVGQQDFAGLDYYWGINSLEFDRIRQLFKASQSDFADAPVDPPGLARALKFLNRWFPTKEILIIENGCIVSADGYRRAQYLEAHIEQVRAARGDGIPVAAYICWSITSNREWGLPFSPNSDFGLYHIQLDKDPALKRLSTESSETFQRIISRAPDPRKGYLS